MASKHEYDFIIVGGGTAGLVLANRLTANPEVQVLVLEAGESHFHDTRTVIPALWPTTQGTEMDWRFATIPQKGLNNRVIALPQGRLLGGSSAINGLAFIPPSAVGIDQWGKMGNGGWDWKTLEPYYRKSRTVTYPSPDTSAHLGLSDFTCTSEGGTGPIKVSFGGTSTDPLPAAWQETFQNLGWPASADPFSGSVTGGFTSAASIDVESGTKCHSGTAYYLPFKERPNLEVLTGVLVERIVFERDVNELIARGVKWKANQDAFSTTALREVILAAGAFSTPKLLELSGIGSPKILQNAGIEVLVDNPSVGENLQDHLMTGISYEVADGVETLDDLRRQVPHVQAAALEEYQTSHSGPLASGGIVSFAVMPVVNLLKRKGTEELEHYLQKPSTNDRHEHPAEDEYFNFVKSVLSSNDEGLASYWLTKVQSNFGLDGQLNDSILPGSYLTIGVTPLHYFSRGNTHIAGPDPESKPVINPRYLENPLDLEILSHLITFIEEIAQQEPMRSLLKDPSGGRRNSELAVGHTLEQARVYAKHSATSNWHPVGTCAMLPVEKGGVVGADLKVHGIKRGLRIVDCSIMPIITRGNPQSTVYAVAERAADLILREYSLW